MSGKEPVYKSQLTGTVDSFLAGKRRKQTKEAGKGDGDVDFLNILDFIDRFKLLPNGLHPVQRFIVKLYYGIPLDSTDPIISVTDRFGSEVLHLFTEVEYLRYLYDHGRCNIREQDDKVRHELILVLGRRSGKSTLAAVFSAYEIYKLLCRGYPQAYYGMPAGSEIRLLCVANDKEQAEIVYGDVQAYAEAIDYFKSSIAHSTRQYMRFRTESDRKKFGATAKGTVVTSFRSSIAKGIRGRGVICAVLDEIAFFVDNGKCQNISGKVLTSRGLISLDTILTMARADRSRHGWTNIDPIEIIQAGGRRAYTTRVYYGGLQKTRLIVTASRYRIEPTPDHRVKVMSDDGDIVWKYARDIKPGDYIGIARGTCFWPELRYDCRDLIPLHGRFQCHIPAVVDERLGEFLGILVGDGTWTSGNCKSHIQVTGGCEQFLPFVQSHFARYFNRFGTSRKSKHVRNTCEVSPWCVTKTSGSFRMFLDKLGYRLDVTKTTKSVPWVIFASPKSVVAAFLRGLFETDGGVEHGGTTVSFATASQSLAEEVQALLLNFGITASIHEKYNRKYARNYFYLCLTGAESRRIFWQEIGFITRRKNLALSRGLSRGRDASNIVPTQVNRVRRIITSIPRSRKNEKGDNLRSCASRIMSSSLRLRAPGYPSYSSLRRFVTLMQTNGIHGSDVDALNEICRLDYYWDLVVSVDKTECETADLWVPDGNEYVAQGMVNHNSSAEKIYRAMNPSLAQFSPKDPNNRRIPTGPSDGRMILISSPDARDGFFYRQYQMAMSKDRGSMDMLVIQAPTWEVNPTLDQSYYEKEYYKDPRVFMTEHGSEFSDRVSGWIEDAKDLMDCIDSEARPKERGNTREVHFAGLDFGISNDGTAIAITRINEAKIDLAYHEIWYPKRSWREVNPHLSSSVSDYVSQLEHVTRLDIDEIANWLLALSKRFYIHKGIFDQWAGPLFEQVLHKRGLRQFEMRNFHVVDTSNMWQTFKMFMLHRQFRMYDWPLPTGSEAGMRHSPLVDELLELQATSAGKNLITVEAPKIAGKHDDQSDALARSVMLASEYIRQNPGVLTVGGRLHELPRFDNKLGYRHYHRVRTRMHGVIKERMVPRIARF
jgi:intein/homing endonuclease